MRLLFLRRVLPQIILLFHVCLFWQIAQAQEFQPDTSPNIKEMLGNSEFRRIFEELSVTKNGNAHLFDEKAGTSESLPAPPKSPDDGDAQKPAPTFDAVLTQHLAQMDRAKYLLMQNLVSAETYGFRKIDVILFEETNFSQGRFTSTSQPLDLAIHGNGFFVVKSDDDQLPPPYAHSPSSSLSFLSPPFLLLRNALTKNAVFYTRYGRFYLTAQRKIALQHDGFTFPLQPEITVPFHVVSCEYRSNGDFFANMPDGSQLKIGELKLARFDSPKKLERLDGVLFRLPPGSGEPVREPPNETVQSCQLETSNVDVAETVATYRRLHELQTLLLEKLRY